MKGEHQKIKDCPQDQQIIGGMAYDAGICQHCYCVYYAPMGEAGLILLPKGNA
jgi:hypothetical protein